MKINLKRNEVSLLYDLIDQKEKNIFIADLLLDLINSKSAFKNKDINTVYDLAASYLDEEDKVELKANLNNKIDLLDVNKYLDNPYNKNIQINEVKYKDYLLCYETLKVNEIFISDEININENNNYLETTSLAYFTKDYKYLTLSKDNVIWMSINPNEINTMDEDIKSMHGNILVLGLGLGYISYMLSLKDDVNSITIIEKDEEIINLFNKYLLNNFKFKNKIKIIYQDALNYLKNNHLDSYQFVYVDLYHNPNDGLKLFLNIKKIESKYSSTNFLYWLNKSLFSLVRRVLLTLLIEVYEGSSIKDYQNEVYETDFLLNKLFRYFENTSITSIKEIYQLITTANIDKIIKDL